MALQLSEWSGELSSKADLFCEASYYNEKLSLWEPLLEPLESTGGQLQPWCIDAEVCTYYVGEQFDVIEWSAEVNTCM
jgi:vacuolar protein sorting-associated protein 13A/C